MIYDIVLHPDDRLRRVCAPVARVDSRVQALANDMLETMSHGDRGVGLAAPQIGVMERMLVCDVRDGSGPRVLINPVITGVSEELIKRTEGCLSIPDVYADVTRPASITVTYIDTRGAPQEFAATDWWATVIQHEIDHLDGKLFIDYLTPLKRDMVLKKYFKILRVKE